VTVETLAQERGTEADEIRQLMLARLLPLPTYLRSDDAQLVRAVGGTLVDVPLRGA
jgi:hypothetical protein